MAHAMASLVMLSFCMHASALRMNSLPDPLNDEADDDETNPMNAFMMNAIQSHMDSMQNSVDFDAKPEADRVDRVCISSATALNFDKFRILDWIAYHNLQGVDCFVLFLDVKRSNLTDPMILDVYNKLNKSPMVKLFNGTYKQGLGESTRIGEKIQMGQVRRILPMDCAYLGLVDTDEYVVFSRDKENSTNAVVSYQLPKVLGRIIGTEAEQPHMGAYLHRWTYGSSGWKHLPPYDKMPEIGHFDHRDDKAYKTNKFFLNIPLAIKYRVHFGEQLSQHVLPMGTISKLAPRMMKSDDTLLSINHYKIASIYECQQKGRKGSHHEGEKRLRECRSSLFNNVTDVTLVKWAEPTRKRHTELFGEQLGLAEFFHQEQVPVPPQ